METVSASALRSTVLTMKLLVDSRPKQQLVVFAEAGKDTVDFLFSLLAMPASTAVRLQGKESMAGSIRNLYSSAEKLADSPNVQLGADNDVAICATMPSPAAARPNSCLSRLPEPPAPAAPALKGFFNCSYMTNIMRKISTVNFRRARYTGGDRTEVRGTRSPSCRSQMTTEASVSGSPPPPAAAAQEAGFVQGSMAMYMVTDDLVISPMSNISTIAQLNACAVRDLGTLQERIVQIGYKEGLEILKASVQSKTVLTDIFLANISMPRSMNNGRGSRPESLAWRA